MRTLVFVGSLGLVTAACGGRVDVLSTAEMGSAGSTGQGATSGAQNGGGADNGTGGFVGKGSGGAFSKGGTSSGGFAGTGSSGTSAGGSVGTMVPYACSPVIPPSDAITDFANGESGWGDPAGFFGGTFVYPASPSDGALSENFTDANMNVSGTVKSYSGFGIWFGSCTNASMFSGIEFEIWSNLDVPVATTFSVQTNSNTPIDPIGMRGACGYVSPDMYSACAQPSITIVITPEPITMAIAWDNLYGGIPFDLVDESGLLGLTWSFSWSDVAVPYPVDVTIDIVRFF